MQRIEDVAAMRQWSREQRAAGARIVFVPTLGGLHEGHAALLDAARANAGPNGKVVASIFLNPTQFDNPEDLSSYPAVQADDELLCAEHGVDAVFTPTTEQIYINGHATFVEVVGSLADHLCAIARPGHFRGVTTVVTKLFNIVDPDAAVFGQKDLQQTLIVNRLIADLSYAIELITVPTVRDVHGIALSSRNRRLSADGMLAAGHIPQALNEVQQAFQDGERNVGQLMALFAEKLLVFPGVEVDYTEVLPLGEFKELEFADESSALFIAVFIDNIRLIDHIHLAGGPITIEEPVSV